MKAKILMMAGCLAAMGAAMAQDINCKDMSNYNICQLNGIRDIGSSGGSAEVPQKKLGQISGATVQNGIANGVDENKERQAALLDFVKKAPIPVYTGVQGSIGITAPTSGSRWADVMEQQGMVQKDGVWVLKNGGGENMSALMEINGYGWSKIKESWVPFNPEKRNTNPEFADFMKKQGFVLSGNSWVPGNTGSYGGIQNTAPQAITSQPTYGGVQNTKPQPTVPPATNQGGYAGVQGSGSSQPASTSGSRWADVMEQQGMVQKDGVWVQKSAPSYGGVQNTAPQPTTSQPTYGGVQNTKPQPTVPPATNQGGYAGVQGGNSPVPVIQFKYPMDRGS